VSGSCSPAAEGLKAAWKDLAAGAHPTSPDREQGSLPGDGDGQGWGASGGLWGGRLGRAELWQQKTTSHGHDDPILWWPQAGLKGGQGRRH